ncbi:MAG: tetratricopeptide repeat protein [Acidimicrobiales bacterium]
MQGSSETETAHDAASAAVEGDVERRRDIAPRKSEQAAAPAPSETNPDVGATVLAEAEALVEQRRFADAARVLDSLQRLRPDDPSVLALTAVANAHHGRNRTKVRSALSQLSTDFGELAITWRTVSDVSLARFQFDPAQKAARTSVQIAPDNVDNWNSLAAAYAGHGWFKEADECLSQATRLNSADHQHAPSGDQALTFGQWQVGRAVNHWAITKTYVALLAVLGFLYMGLLGLALALSVPMLLREIRVRQAPEPFRSLADHAWRTEHRLRVANAAVVLGVLIAWLVVFSITR